MTTPAHVPVTAWTYPGPCGAPNVQLIPCCDASSCTSHHISAPRQFYSRPNAVGIGPYHCPPYRHHHHHHHHHTRHRLPTPSLSGVPVPLAGSVYQPHHVPSSSMVAPPSMFSSQQQGPMCQTVYHSQQVSHAVYQSSALLNRTQSEDAVTDGNVTNVAFPPTSSQVYQRQAPHPTPIRHHTAMSAQPLLLQPLPSTEFITGGTLSAQQYRPVTSARQHGWQTYQTLAAPYPGYLLHFLTMLGQPPATAVMSTSLAHHQQTALQQHEDMAAAAAAGDLDSYEALLNLAERLGEVKSRGLTRSDIERLRCYRYNIADDGNNDQSEIDAAAGSASVLDQTSCVVCLCEFEPRELVRALPCQHEFHANCVDRWLKMNRTCPLCRADVTELTKVDVD